MDRSGVRAHWEDWAKRFGADLRATTRSVTAKRLEIDALIRAIETHGRAAPQRVLEVGCGNGLNGIALAQAFPRTSIQGIDYVDAMVAAARHNARSAGLDDRLRFAVGDVLDLAAEYRDCDVVVSDRCLINLASPEEQKDAITTLAARLAPGGLLLLIENSLQTHARQNDLRETLGLPRRTPAAFNLFFDDREIVPHLRRCLELVAIEDFISLHDLALYVLAPGIGDGAVDYAHPLVEAATRLSLALSDEERRRLPALGQNRLYVGRRAAP